MSFTKTIGIFCDKRFVLRLVLSFPSFFYSIRVGEPINEWIMEEIGSPSVLNKESKVKLEFT